MSRAGAPEPEFRRELEAGELDAYFAEAEGAYGDITPGTEKRVVWAGEAGRRTPLSVLYLHGFSATSEETRPVPDRVAEALGANLVFTRLAGHGRGGAAMVEGSVQGWMNDTAEALAAARAAGEEVLVMATSTGGTLAAIAAAHPELSRGLRGVVFLSPNFAIANPLASLLSLPGMRRLTRSLVAGRDRVFAKVSEAHATYWATTYPFAAVFPVVDLLRRVRALDLGRAKAPALFLYVPADKVVSARAAERAAARWGGPVTLAAHDLPPGCDAFDHVIAGDILSPAMNDTVTRAILDWHAAL